MRRTVQLAALVLLLTVLSSLPARADAIYFVLDVSGSMGIADIDSAGTTRFQAMKTGVDAIAKKIPSGVQVGFLTYSDIVTPRLSLTTNVTTFQTLVAALTTPSGGTFTGPALDVADSEIKNATGTRIILLLTDGLPSGGAQQAVDTASAIGKKGILICAIGFGADVGVAGANSQFLIDIAAAANGAAILAPNAATLGNALDTCLTLFTAPSSGRVLIPVITSPNPAMGTGNQSQILFSRRGAEGIDSNTISIKMTTVKIYDMAGRLINRVNAPIGGSPTISWNTKNSSGQFVASGMYFYVIDFADNSHGRGKFTIIR